MKSNAVQTALAAVSEQGAQLGSDASERTHAAMPCGSRAGGGRPGWTAGPPGRAQSSEQLRPPPEFWRTAGTLMYSLNFTIPKVFVQQQPLFPGQSILLLLPLLFHMPRLSQNRFFCIKKFDFTLELFAVWTFGFIENASSRAVLLGEQ